MSRMAEAPSAAEVLARAGGENFPVASILFPRELRPHLMSVYGFARLVDQVGDEAGDSPAERLRLLDWVNDELDTVYRGVDDRALRDPATALRSPGRREPPGPDRHAVCDVPGPARVLRPVRQSSR